MFVLLVLFFLNCPSLYSEKVGTDHARIAAVVNQYVITVRELKHRLDFAIATLNMPNTQESRNAMHHSVLQNLIIEKLQESSANEAGIKISDSEVDQSLVNLAKENGMTVEQLNDKFKAMGITIKTLKDRLRAQVIWSRFIRALYGKQVIVTDGDVIKEREKIQRTFDADQYELIEIVLPIDSKNPAKSKQDADRLYSQVREPMTNFRMVAQQFGAQSGYVGWKTIRQMDEEIAKAIQNLPVGSITMAIEVQNAYRIVKLVDKKLAGQGSFRSRKISMSRVAIKLPAEMTDENAAILANITAHMKGAKGCSQFQQAGRDANGHVEVSPEQSMSSFPESLQVILDNLSPGQVAGPLQDGSEVNFLMVCTVKNPAKDTLPSNAEIKEMLEQKEFQRQAMRILKSIFRIRSCKQTCLT